MLKIFESLLWVYILFFHFNFLHPGSWTLKFCLCLYVSKLFGGLSLVHYCRSVCLSARMVGLTRIKYCNIQKSVCQDSCNINIAEGKDMTNGCIYQYIWLLSMSASPPHLPFGLVYKEDGDKMFVFLAFSEKWTDFDTKMPFS